MVHSFVQCPCAGPVPQPSVTTGESIETSSDKATLGPCASSGRLHALPVASGNAARSGRATNAVTWVNRHSLREATPVPVSTRQPCPPLSSLPPSPRSSLPPSLSSLLHDRYCLLSSRSGASMGNFRWWQLSTPLLMPVAIAIFAICLRSAPSNVDSQCRSESPDEIRQR